MSYFEIFKFFALAAITTTNQNIEPGWPNQVSNILFFAPYPLNRH